MAAAEEKAVAVIVVMTAREGPTVSVTAGGDAVL